MQTVTCDRCDKIVTGYADQGVTVCDESLDLCEQCQRAIENFAKQKVTR